MYRLTCAEIDALYAYADGCCHICKTPEPETKARKLLIDHAKDYGYHAVRGLVCDKCNALMRRVDNREKFDPAAARYMYDSWFVRMLVERTADTKRQLEPK